MTALTELLERLEEIRSNGTLEEGKRRLFARTKVVKDCWEWTGSRSRNGYGETSFLGRRFLAHRLSYVLAIGPFDSTLFVCHRCDNPPCVKPSHLFLGTAKDNAQDCLRKGRWDKNPKPGFEKLWNERRARTQCRNGHEYVDGSFVLRKGKGRTFRECLICMRAHKLKYYRRIKAREALARAEELAKGVELLSARRALQ